MTIEHEYCKPSDTTAEVVNAIRDAEAAGRPLQFEQLQSLHTLAAHATKRIGPATLERFGLDERANWGDLVNALDRRLRGLDSDEIKVVIDGTRADVGSGHTSAQLPEHERREREAAKRQEAKKAAEANVEAPESFDAAKWAKKVRGEA